jgi:ParB family chromosome partitioning protein
VRPEDIPARAESEADEGYAGGPEINMPSATRRSIVSADPAEAARKEQGVSLSLAEDPRATRHQILKAHLAVDYATAFDVMLYSMCKRVLRNGYDTPPVAVALTAAETYRSKEVLSDTVAARMLDTTHESLNLGWIDLTRPSDFEAFSSLSEADKQALFAWCTAYAVSQQLATDSGANPVIEVIGRRMEVDVATCWRPTAETYWSRVKKGHAIAVARELIGDRWADDKAKEKKAVIAADMELAFSEDPKAAAGLTPDTATRTATWLPDGMVFSGDIRQASVDGPYTMIDEDCEEEASGADAFTEADAEGSEGEPGQDADEIPAFLRQAAE